MARSSSESVFRPSFGNPSQSNWGGVVDAGKCRCGLDLRFRTANTRKNFGRPYCSCPKWSPEGNKGCRFHKFLDESSWREELEELQGWIGGELAVINRRIEDQQRIVDQLGKKLENCYLACVVQMSMVFVLTINMFVQFVKK